MNIFSRNVIRTKIVTVSGALATNIDWNDDLNDKNSELYLNTAVNAKADLEKLFMTSNDVEFAIVEITGFEEFFNPSKRKRRQVADSKATVYYEADLTVPESMTNQEIDSSVTSAVQNADPSQFASFDTFDDFSVMVMKNTPETTQLINTTETTTAETTTAETTTAETTTAETTVATTSPETKAVLILSTNIANNRPLLVDFEGKLVKFLIFFLKFILGNIQNVSEFRYGNDASAVHGCGVTLRGEFYYFGGLGPDSKQISKIFGCNLTRLTRLLPFEFVQGACNTLHERSGMT